MTGESRKQVSAKQDEILERRAKVWELRVSGESIENIAAQLGWSVGTIHGDIAAYRNRLDDDNTFKAETERALGISRLDALTRKLLGAMALVPDDVDLLAKGTNAIIRVDERRAKLLGLDRPYETIIHQTEASPEEARRLMAEKFGRTAKQDTEPQQEEHESP